MSKLIAVWGSPGAGKTVLAASLASALAKDGHNTMLVAADDITPGFPVLLPFHKNEKNCSIGHVLEATDIINDNILGNCLTIKENHLAVIAYANGENELTYVKNTIERSNDFILHISHLADYVVVDCASDFRRNKLTDAALQQAEVVFQMYTAEPRSQIFFAAQRASLDNEKYNYMLFTRILRLGDKKALNAVNETKSAIGNVQGVIPYSVPVMQQFAAGIFESGCPDRKYEKALQELIKEHIYEE